VVVFARQPFHLYVYESIEGSRCRKVFDRHRIERAGFEEALRQMPAGVIIVEAPSGEIVSVNRQAQEIFERYLGRSVPSELGDLRELHDSGAYETFYPDGRPCEMDRCLYYARSEMAKR